MTTGHAQDSEWITQLTEISAVETHMQTWRTLSTLSSRAPPASLCSPLSSEDGVYPLSPDLLAALIRHPAARLRHLSQGSAVQLTCDGKSGQPLEVAAEGESIRLHDAVAEQIFGFSKCRRREWTDILMGSVYHCSFHRDAETVDMN